MKPTTDLMALASNGANLIIDASTKPTVELMRIASMLKENRNLTLINSSKKPTSELQRILGVCKGNLTLDFTLFNKVN